MPFDQTDVLSAFDILANWMENDIQSMINADSNFAASLCILAYCEALGRFHDGSIGDPDNSAGRRAFEYFLGKMGYNPHEANRVYSDLRNGMAHSYFPNKDMRFIMSGGARGIDLAVASDVKFYVKKAFDEFKNAIPQVRSDIDPGTSTNIVSNLRSRIDPVSSPTSLSWWVTNKSGA